MGEPDRDPWAPVAAGKPDTINVGGDVIPRAWAEHMLRELRDKNTATWRRLLGNASTSGGS